MSTDNTLTIPPNTRLLSIERLDGFCASWAIWIHTNANELQKPHNERQGTYLLLDEHGHVTRVTVNGDQEETIEVM